MSSSRELSQAAGSALDWVALRAGRYSGFDLTSQAQGRLFRPICLRVAIPPACSIHAAAATDSAEARRKW